MKNMYNFRSHNYLLSKLENHDRRKEQVNTEDYTIEHIMPQNERLSVAWQEELGPNWKEVQAQYLHTIGNLTLTGYNPELSDRPFQEKRNMEGGFADSPIHLNRSLARLEHWNEEEIKHRASSLADLAVKVWSIPLLSSDQVNKYGKQTQKAFLAEVVGPVEHPLAGFIPEGFKIIQISERSFYYFRYVENEWIQYGNGKTAWYAMSWETVGKWVRDFYKKNTMPLGVGRKEVLATYSVGTVANSGKSYTLEDYPGLQGNIRDVFEHLRRRILNLDASVREECKKLYIAYKTTTNFVDIEPQKRRLRVTLNMPFSEINDPKSICRDITGIGHFGNGDVEISVTSLDQLEDVIDLIRQSFERHSEEVYA